MPRSSSCSMERVTGSREAAADLRRMISWVDSSCAAILVVGVVVGASAGSERVLSTANRRTPMQYSAKGLRVVVTAGAAGIGRAIVRTFVEHGARVHICDVDDRMLKETASA